ncbi:PIN domain nuclease [Ammonifex thiophilus]|uniref:Ribonuclease VapC n=1 Tax=Ammonifex thiophilus TaxID=444093 RepID=A0A3D8P1W2_9THEO|nr:PIN domain nuclease [Ammonifex thiophilus]RDV81833.1 PIN domain nuclease [Ammonifex thiophilus]
MSERYLVDTSVWIEALRPKGQQEVVRWLKEALLREAVVLAPPVKTEILLGAKDERQFAELSGVLDALPLLGHKDAVWERAASLGFRLRRLGLVVPLVDLLIASWALVNDCTLVHRDRHFGLIANVAPELKLLDLSGFSR